MRHSRLAAFFSLAAVLSAAQALSSETEGRRWTACGWGGGGWFWSSAADPLDSDVFYMGGDVDGVWKTVDGGESWLFANRGLSNYAVYACEMLGGEFSPVGRRVRANSDGALELGIELSAPPASMFFKVVAFPPETTGILHR